MSSKDKKFKTSIGGQALIEGVMMRGPKKAAMAVRKPDGELWVDVWDAPKKTVWSKIPIVRGVVNMVVSLMDGYKCLMKSAEISTEGLEEEKPSKFEEWLEKKLGDKMTKVVSVLSAILGIAFAVLLFTFLPAFLVGFLKGILPRWGAFPDRRLFEDRPVRGVSGSGEPAAGYEADVPVSRGGAQDHFLL